MEKKRVNTLAQGATLGWTCPLASGARVFETPQGVDIEELRSEKGRRW